MSSPFEPRFGTNYTPTDEERVMLADIIERSRSAIQALETEAAKLKGALSSVHQRQAEHQASIQRHSAFLSPIRRIPHDILSTIFEALVNSGDSSSLSMSHRHPAVVVSHVSQLWRALALGTPSLWSCINVDIPPYLERPPGSEEDELLTDLINRSQATMDQTSHTTRTWIERSSRHGLSIRIRVRVTTGDVYSISPSVHACISPVLGMLVGVADRWRDFSVIPTWVMPRFPYYGMDAPFNESRPQLLGDIIYLTESQLPSLRSLSLEVELEGYNFLNGIPTRMTEGGLFRAPNLRRLRLDQLGSRVTNLPVRWANLTHFRFAGYPTQNYLVGEETLHFDPQVALALLVACPSLIECEFSNIHRTETSAVYFPGLPSTQSTPAPTEPATTAPRTNARAVAQLRHLNNLSLQSSSLLPISFLEALDMPNLRRLHLQKCYPATGGFTSDPAYAMDWIRVMGAQLTELTIKLDSFAHDDIHGCLAGLPSIQVLDVTTASWIRPPAVGDPPLWNQQIPRRMALASSNFLVEALTPSAPSNEASAGVEFDCLCPRLEKFTCMFVVAPCEERVLIDLIRSRRTGDGGIARLRSVDINMPTLRRKDVDHELRSMGVDLTDFELTIRYLEPAPL